MSRPFVAAPASVSGAPGARWRHWLACLGASLAWALPLAGPAQAASFDCTKAGTAVERLVCATDSLSRLDEELDETFAVEVENPARTVGLRAAQRAWLARRDRCADAACLTLRYEERIVELACDKESRMGGSAIGSNRCSYFQLRLLERQLVPLLAQRAKRALESSSNPEHTTRVLAAEDQAWRAWRDAQCALYGDGEGGAPGWKNAFAGYCAVDETRKRIAALQAEGRPR